MSLKLKNANVLPLEHETINVLGLDIPITKRLPFGAQVEILDLSSKRDEGEIGNFEFLMRTFCLFTRRLPKRDRVDYAWLSSQDLEPDEIAAIVAATTQLLAAFSGGDDDEEVGEGNAPKPKREGKKSKS